MNFVLAHNLELVEHVWWHNMQSEASVLGRRRMHSILCSQRTMHLSLQMLYSMKSASTPPLTVLSCNAMLTTLFAALTRNCEAPNTSTSTSTSTSATTAIGLLQQRIPEMLLTIRLLLQLRLHPILIPLCSGPSPLLSS